MNKFISYPVTLLSLLFSICCHAQTRDTTQKLYTYYEQMAQFPGNLSEYLAKHLEYPKEAQSANIQGRVKVGFRISKMGKVDSAYILESVHPLLDSEARRLVMAMPKWKPAKGRRSDEKKFVNVSVYYTLPVKFTLKEEEGK